MIPISLAFHLRRQHTHTRRPPHPALLAPSFSLTLDLPSPAHREVTATTTKKKSRHRRRLLSDLGQTVVEVVVFSPRAGGGVGVPAVVEAAIVFVKRKRDRETHSLHRFGSRWRTEVVTRSPRRCGRRRRCVRGFLLSLWKGRGKVFLDPVVYASASGMGKPETPKPHQTSFSLCQRRGQ